MTFEEQGQFPSKEQLDQVGGLPVLDKAGKAHTFRSLWDRKEPTERRNIVVFIRHFFCGVSLPHAYAGSGLRRIEAHKLILYRAAKSTSRLFRPAYLRLAYTSAIHLQHLQSLAVATLP